jgi:TolA-binding protein
MRMEDTASDALWALAQDFRAHHDEEGARATLRYLAVHYPSSRYAREARAELGLTDGGLTDGGA